MTPFDLKKLFPAASKSFLESNPFPQLVRKKPSAILPLQEDKKVMKALFRPKERHSYSFVITGQIVGGKNHMGIARNGTHYAKPKWKAWRDEKVRQLKFDLPADWTPISTPCEMRWNYYAGDKRRRDCPATLDSIFHLLEKAGIVTDDTLIWPTQSSRLYDKANPRAEITLIF